MAKISKEISAGFVVFRRTESGSKFLLLFDRSGDWNFPRGKLAEEERSYPAAFRETREETGLRRRELKVNRGFKAYERFVFQRKGKKIAKTVIFYLAETKRKQIRLSEEHEGFGWFSYKDARRLVQSFRDREMVLKQANNFISRQDRPYGRRLPQPRSSGERGRQPL